MPKYRCCCIGPYIMHNIKASLVVPRRAFNRVSPPSASSPSEQHDSARMPACRSIKFYSRATSRLPVGFPTLRGRGKKASDRVGTMRRRRNGGRGDARKIPVSFRKTDCSLRSLGKKLLKRFVKSFAAPEIFICPTGLRPNRFLSPRQFVPWNLYSIFSRCEHQNFLLLEN